MRFRSVKTILGFTGDFVLNRQTALIAMKEWKRQTIEATRANDGNRLRLLSQVKQAIKRVTNRPRCRTCDGPLHWDNKSGYCQVHWPWKLQNRNHRGIEEGGSVVTPGSFGA